MRTLPIGSALLVCAAPAAAQCEITFPQAQPPFTHMQDSDLDGDTLVHTGDGQRFVVFERDPGGWTQSASVLIDASAFQYNRPVALGGDRLAVGSPDDGPSPTEHFGSVRVFERASGWQVPVVVRPEDGAAGDYFGGALDLAGDVLVVGAPQLSWEVTGGPGRVYVFEHDGAVWRQAAVLHPHHFGDDYTAFGTAIATDGHTIVVGSSSDAQFGAIKGAVYVYERGPGGWAEVDKLVPLGSSIFFGQSVAVEGSTLAGGALGVVRVYERSGQDWESSKVLTPVDAGLAYSFGQSVAVYGDDLVVGAPDADLPSGPDYTGALHVYRRGPTGWAGVAAIPSDSAVPWAKFGRGLALDGGTALWSGTAPDARMHDLGLGELSTVCSGSASSAGVPVPLHVSGCDSLLADALQLTLWYAPPLQATWLRVSDSAASTPFGNGTLCLGGAPTLLAAGATDAQGAWNVALDFAAPPFATWAPGATAYLQTGFRDPGFGAGHGTSAAVALALQP